MLERAFSNLYAVEKKVLDITVASFATIVSVPIIGYLAYQKYIEDGESPFFVQERVGKGGKIIKIIKIRSMRGGEEPDEERVTELGKWLRKTHLDELPQFWLVFKGYMSIVGPRPITPQAMSNAKERSQSESRGCEMEDDYERLLGGITGIWQLNGTGYENDPKMYHPNKLYLRNKNIMLDIVIIYRTAQKVLKSLK